MFTVEEVNRLLLRIRVLLAHKLKEKARWGQRELIAIHSDCVTKATLELLGEKSNDRKDIC